MTEPTGIQIIEETKPSNGSVPSHALGEPDPAQRPARLALYLGIALCAIGGIVLYLGYDGAATHALVQAQMPYVISGGLFGAALLVIGTVVIGLHVLLRVQADLRTELAETRRSMEEVAEAIARTSVLGSALKVTTNGTVMVARGGSSYHRADCKLVTRAGGAKPIPREEAAQAGLVPCRICKP